MQDLEYLHLTPEDALPQLSGKPFKAVIAIESDTTPEWREKVCDWLVRNGCRCAMTWGLDCEGWHDEIDHANLEMFDNRDIPEDDFVMTTWHANEPLEDPFWFSGQCAFHPSLELNKTYIIHIAANAKAQNFLGRYRAAQDKGDED